MVIVSLKLKNTYIHKSIYIHINIRIYIERERASGALTIEILGSTTNGSLVNNPMLCSYEYQSTTIGGWHSAKNKQQMLINLSNFGDAGNGHEFAYVCVFNFNEGNTFYECMVVVNEY